MENSLCEELEAKIQQKISEIAALEDLIPGVLIIHDLPYFRVRYMSPLGLKLIGISHNEIDLMSNAEYHNRFFNAEDAAEYVPKISALIHDNSNEIVSTFQQVRIKALDDWALYLSASRILLRDGEDKPLLLITTAIPIDPQHNVTAKVSRLLDENNFLRKHHHQFSKLTSREKDILKLLALGKSNAEIADQLHISVATVETHRRNIRQKLKVSNNYELSQYARSFDLI